MPVMQKAISSTLSETKRRLTAKSLFFLLPAFALTTGVLAIPVARLIEVSFHNAQFGQIQADYTIESYKLIILSPLYWLIYAKTFLAAMAVTILCILLGYPIASHLVKAREKTQSTLFFLIAAPLLINTVVRSYGWLLILGRKGVLNTILSQLGLIDEPLSLSANYIGMIIGSTQVFLPFMILSIATSLRSIDRRLLESASVLGASTLYQFVTVELPLASAGIVAGATLVFSLMLGAFVTPLMLGGTALQYLSIAVYTDALVLFNLPRAIALSMILLCLTAAIYAIQSRLSQHKRVVR